MMRCLAAGLGCLVFAALAYGQDGGHGYRLRVEPGMMTMRHTERPRLTVAVEDASGQPVDDVRVDFTVSEGVVTPAGSSRTQDGRVTGTFTPAFGGDDPRRAFVVVSAAGHEVTVFIDIVPAVYGR
jgi:hypothetical protein